MTTSSSAAFPARSPIPLIVHSTCLAPPRTPASELATAIPRSSWQCVETTTPSPDTATIRAMSASYSHGIAYPTVSGMLMVVAPAAIAVVATSQRYPMSDLAASSAENSTSSHRVRACRTVASTRSRTSDRVRRSLRAR